VSITAVVLLGDAITQTKMPATANIISILRMWASCADASCG
jgi:hypothetical protein